VYGIPEHAASFALKSTQGASADAFTDPYRLYTLDVFEHAVDVPMALYGAIPFAISHSPAVTSGAFWWNPSETFVDVYTNSSSSSSSSSSSGSSSSAVDAKGNSVRWMSESGVVDVMLLPGPTPADVFKQVKNDVTQHVSKLISTCLQQVLTMK
jgi:mannosyl-oligosaccharide alpha-1,3-glucosidase